MMFDYRGMNTMFLIMAVLSVVGLTFGLWKVVEVVIWLLTHLTVGWK